MVWARFDDRYSESAKILDAGPMAELLDVRGIIYSCRNETDGLISPRALTRISTGIPNAKGKAAVLVDVGRWKPNEGGGWLIHDFLTYNPSHALLEWQRMEGKERAHRSRERNVNQTFGSGDPRARAQAGTGISSDLGEKAKSPWKRAGMTRSEWMAAGQPNPNGDSA